MTDQYDPFSREAQLRAESDSWDTSVIDEATSDDIPVIDLGDYFDGNEAALESAASQLRQACETVGFFSLTGHGVDWSLVSQLFEQIGRFHQLPLDDKLAIRMDRAGWPHGGMGYLPFKNAKLPSREKVNHNEAFLVKADHNISLAHNQWPDPAALPAFRSTVQNYTDELTRLGKRLLPVYARALDMPADFFDEAFINPLYRLRMTHYPALGESSNTEFGINPHVDTTFCTILAQDAPGLVIFGEQRQTWLRVPVIDQAFVVNTGELLRQWTNDRFISVKHFANNNRSEHSRYSIPFFLNANADYVMRCVPSCFSESNPAKYPPVSYSQSQAIAQGE